MKPLIGITPQYDTFNGIFKLSPFYAKAVADMGGIPVILPYNSALTAIEETVSALNGLLFSGGNDVDPLRYGEDISSSCGKIEYERDEFELNLCKYAEENDISVLGICRGCQVMAVSAGGALFQQTEGHFQTADRYMASHTVSVCKDSPLYSAIKAEKTDVNSFHRQSIKNTGKLKKAAVGENAEIEAVYYPEKKFHLGIQWHPERMYTTNIHAALIFKAFIDSCR